MKHTIKLLGDHLVFLDNKIVGMHEMIDRMPIPSKALVDALHTLKTTRDEVAKELQIVNSIYL